MLLKSGRMVKPVRFEESGIRDVGDPVTTARIYDSQDADELIFLNIGKDVAFLQGTLRAVAQNCFVPLTAGGGVRTLEDITGLLRAGADKVSLNTAALEDPYSVFFTPEEAKRMLEETGCDYIMLGRAAMKNPFIFTQINEYLAKGSYTEIADEERIKHFFRYL